MNATDDQSASETSRENAKPCETVVNCYSAVDRFFPASGLFDLTEGMYLGNPKTSYEQAQANQHDYLLHQIECGPNRRILDLGCGYGTLLERAHALGAEGVGITISPEQLKSCHQKMFDVYNFSHDAIPREWNQTFDGVIANGSIEHFVQPEDVAGGRQDKIYRQMFARVHRLIDPNSTARRFASTTIHFVRKLSKENILLKNPFAFRWGSDNFHRAVLVNGWGGYYPDIGQLRRCAEGYFELIEEIDGTEDYLLTSEEWMRRIHRALGSIRVIRIMLESIPVLARSSKQFLTLLLSVLFSDSWNWQFRPPNAPTRLLRQTWNYRERP